MKNLTVPIRYATRFARAYPATPPLINGMAYFSYALLPPILRVSHLAIQATRKVVHSFIWLGAILVAIIKPTGCIGHHRNLALMRKSTIVIIKPKHPNPW